MLLDHVCVCCVCVYVCVHVHVCMHIYTRLDGLVLML